MGRSSSQYLKHGYRVRAVEGFADGDHWQGGPAYHRGADCPVCKRPLLLLWDINCADPRFQDEPKPIFSKLQRLPLYYCWKCVATLSYQVSSSDSIRIVSHAGDYQGDEFPYPNYPTAFPRFPLELTNDKPENLAAIIRRWEREMEANDDFIGECLQGDERDQLQAWYGHPVTLFGADFVHHQLGGVAARLAQGLQGWECGNDECRQASGILGRLMGRRSRVKFLAVILNDPPRGLPMVEELDEKTRENWNSTNQVVFQICEGCLTVHASNMCD
jgi:hypothetical protein